MNKKRRKYNCHEEEWKNILILTINDKSEGDILPNEKVKSARPVTSTKTNSVHLLQPEQTWQHADIWQCASSRPGSLFTKSGETPKILLADKMGGQSVSLQIFKELDERRRVPRGCWFAPAIKEWLA